MELAKLKDLIIELDSTENLDNVVNTINEIELNLKSDPSPYIHLILREKFFLLVQSIVESNNDLLVKFAFNSLTKFLISESTCNLCSTKEKSQFLLNILRYIQHSLLSNEITKIEIFKFLLNNHECIEPLLNTKILNSLIEISINETECENKFLQSSSKALIIKYIAVVSNQISSIVLNGSDNHDAEIKNLDSFIVNTFTTLLDIFNQEHRSFEIRNLILECIELLLNNLIVEKQKFYDIRNNKEFIEFAWKRFCPSILFQFGDCGLSNNVSSIRSLNFKQIYTILIQLTGLIGGDKVMIPVFEAIFQRILFFPPEQDNHILLKLFKSYVNRDFLLSLIILNESNEDQESSKTMNEFTLINIIIGYYRNCYEHSIKQPNEKILQFLSFECIHSYVKQIYDLFKENSQKHELISGNISLDSIENSSTNIDLDEKIIYQINKSADDYANRIFVLITETITSDSSNLEFNIKKLCLDFKENSTENFLKVNSFKFLITSYMSLYVVFKNTCNKDFNLTKFEFNADVSNQNFFVHRIIMYDECDFRDELKLNDMKLEFTFWLKLVYLNLLKISETKSEIIRALINDNKSAKEKFEFLLSQIDCLTKIKYFKNSKAIKLKNNKLELIKKLLKCSWTYLVDVLIGFVQNTKLESLEVVLFSEKFELDDSVVLDELYNDVTFTNFAFKATLDSLYQLIQILISIDGMDKELNQLLYILVESNFYKNNTFIKSYEDLNLNKIISLDFVLYITSELIFNLEQGYELTINKESNEILWTYMTEATFFCFSLQANLEFPNSDLTKNQFLKENTFTKYLMNTKQKLFRSVYSNLNETSETRSINRAKSFDLNEKYQLNDHIISSTFFFMNKFKFKINLKTNKINLIDNLSSKIYEFLFNGIFNKLEEKNTCFFDLIWKFCSNICLFSKRFLIDELSLKVQNEYFSFNYLIIDKLEDFLGKLVARLKPNKNHNEISIFFTDIWLSIFLDYFQKIFSKCGSIKRISKYGALNGTNLNVNSKLKKNYTESLFVIDFSICKKLIYLIQNLFEVYNSNSVFSHLSIDYLEFRKVKKIIKEENIELVRTPSSTGSSTAISSPIGIEHNFSEPADLIKKLESYKTNLNKKTSCNSATRLFYSNTTSILMPSFENDIIDLYLIDEVFNFNSLILIPFKRLMLKKSLESNIKDSILSSICEIVERTSFRIKNSWNLIFYCLSRVPLDEKINKKKRRKIRKFTHKSLNDSFESSTSFHSYKSDSSIYSSGSDFEEIFSSHSSSCSSDQEQNNSTFNFPTLSFRFESYRIRLNSLIDVFNVFIKLAENSSHITANGTYDFIKCVSNYLQYKITISIDFKNPKKLIAQKTEDSFNENMENAKNNSNNDQDDEEDLFLSANDYSIQERHFHLTSNYDHLCQLSNATGSNTQIKPFILCIEKMFDALVIKRRGDFFCNSEDTSKIQMRNFEVNGLEKNPDLNIEELNLYFFSNETRKLIEQTIKFENRSEIDYLNQKFESYFVNDKKNYAKILIFIFQSLSSRVYLAQDEINSVQIVQLLYDLANKLIRLNELEISGYVILEILAQDLNFQIDLSELRNKKFELDSKAEAKFNPKLLENTFFISSLIGKCLEKLITLVTFFAKAVKTDLFHTTILYSIVNRLFYLLTKCLIKKLTTFDSLMEVNFINNLNELYVTCINIDDSSLTSSCLNSIKIFHTLSLIPFETLLKNYTKSTPKTSDSENIERVTRQSDFSNLEVLTQKCKTAWELHNVKRAFNLAKTIFSFEKICKSNQSLDDLLKINEEYEYTIDDNYEVEEEETISSNDDKNFFRDFTLKFNQNSDYKTNKIFNDYIEFKLVNLTCFINAFQFHTNLLNLLKILSSKINLEHNSDFVYEILRFFTKTYILSAKLEENLSLKVLLSKIFYLNYESSLASFTDLIRKSFLLISFLFIKKNIINLKLKNSLRQELHNYNSLEEIDDSTQSKLKFLFISDPKTNFFEEYFYYFVINVSEFYHDLNEKSHGRKLETKFLLDLIKKYENDNDILNETEESLNQEIVAVFEKFKESNANVVDENSESTNGDSYSQKDARFLYKFWSHEMIPYFLVSLSEPVSNENKDLHLVKLVSYYSNDSRLCKKEFIKSLAKMIIAFNSCTSFCQCDIENENSIVNLDFTTIKNVSKKLFTVLLLLINK